MSRIQHFYAGENVFITGATGFVGKVLLEKLIRSCRDVGTVYVLIRPKKGKNIQDRLAELLDDTVFDVLRSEYPDFKSKIVGLSGDVSNSELGLSPVDRGRIIQDVSVIFHVAATVRFDEELEKAVAINVNSVKYIIDIAKACKKLKVAVYVSTAFSNCTRDKIDEEIYTPPMSHTDTNALMDIAERSNWSQAVKHQITEKIMGKWPNTYSFTKAIAEGAVAKYAKDLPFAIFRPSIVIATRKEPVPGWIGNMMGVSGASAGMGTGVIHAMLLDLEQKVDLVPADMVCNALLACAWETAITERRNYEDIPVYNFVSGPENPITWKQMVSTCELYRQITPASQSIYYSAVVYTRSKLLFTILEFILHLLPALVFDNVRKLLGKKPLFYGLHLKIANMIRAVSFFTTNEWTFKNRRVQNLWDRCEQNDKEIFPFSIRDLEWDKYLQAQVRGVRRYLLKDSDDTIIRARRRQVVLYVIHMVVRTAFGVLMLFVTWKLLRGLGFQLLRGILKL